MYLIINKWVTAVKVSSFSGQYLRNHRTLDIGVLGYIGIVWPKEHSPEVRSFPPGTPCITSSVYTSSTAKVDWACYRCILHLQQYSHRLNFYESASAVTSDVYLSIQRPSFFYHSSAIERQIVSAEWSAQAYTVVTCTLQDVIWTIHMITFPWSTSFTHPQQLDITVRFSEVTVRRMG